MPCIFLTDLSDEKIKAYRLADNKVSEAAEWDVKKLEKELDKLANMQIDMSIFGFENDDGEKDKKPEVEFTDELLLEHNYIILYFDNPLDWEVAKDKFGLKIKKDLKERKSQPTGIGRVVNGKEFL